jgi:hypothetical protein
MTLEERVTQLETFIGDMSTIQSVYANSLKEVCDKYLSILYIEEYDSNNKNILNVNGYLGNLDSVSDLPHNIVINVRASHSLELADGEVSKIKFKRDNQYIELALKKYDRDNPGNLIYLDAGDYTSGIIYNIYINSQNIAIICSNDSGVAALSECSVLNNLVSDIQDSIAALATSISMLSMNATTAGITITTANIGTLSLLNALTIPANSICSIPTSNNHITNKEYVDGAIQAAITEYHNTYHIMNTIGATEALSDSSIPNGAVYYRYE